MSVFKSAIIVGTSIVLSGCAYVYSQPVEGRKVQTGSISYALQDSIVDLNLADPGNGIDYRKISIVERTVADRNAQVAVRIDSNPFSKETLVVTVNEQSTLLEAINSTVDGTLDEIAVEAARSVGRLRGAGFLSDNAGQDAQEVRTIATFRVGDQVEFAAAAKEFRRRTGFGVHCLQGCADVSVLPPRESEAVIYYRTPAVLKLAFCRGACGATKNGLPGNVLTIRTVETFNSSKIAKFPIRGSAFGEVVDNITFADGVPKSITFNGTNEALDAVKVPGAVVGSLFAGLVAGSGDQKSIIDAEKAVADAEKARADARKAAAEATIAEIEAIRQLNCARNPVDCEETAQSTGDELPDGL